MNQYKITDQQYSLAQFSTCCAHYHSSSYCITLYIKFGESSNGKECAKLNGKIIRWVAHIKHLGNFLDSTLSDKLDTRSKISAFIGYVNKVKVNFGHLQMYVLCKLFKIYCCSFYGSQM